MRNYSKLLLLLTTILIVSCGKGTVKIIVLDENNRSIYGKQLLEGALVDCGYKISKEGYAPKVKTIFIGETNSSVVLEKADSLNISLDKEISKEGYQIVGNENNLFVAGADPSGTLYGCIGLMETIKEEMRLPKELNIIDAPEMVMRGTCIGLQKTEYLPDRTVYEYPYTPENFPWFYDKEHWIEYLDMMVENRMNALYLWNGHPFASLVKLEAYPYAVEVDDATFEKNKEVFKFLTEEADKRGIWVIQMFYNIIVSKPFAEHHGIKTQERSRPILPLVADYTQKSIAAFVEEYPNVGLMVCLGEAMHTIEDDIEWFTETIIPGVRDGLAALGSETEPPIVLRGHDTDPQRVMEAALPIYKNLYTTHKYNGESLTTYTPRGSWASIHQGLGSLGSVHISNVHILANLEPFRYGSPTFIRKSVDAMHKIQSANGLHLYPQTSYWDWPYTADKTEPRLKQIDRDWIWYKAWARYAWKSERYPAVETNYWANQLSDYYGCDKGLDIMYAYDEFGEIAPKLLRRFGISDGNRQTLLLGMFMSQLINPYKWRVYQSFYDSNGPEGEILLEYAKKEWNNEPHKGETPPQIIREVLLHGQKAVEYINNAAPKVKQNKAEFERLKNDVYCYNAFANYFAQRVEAAILVLRYKYSNDVNDLVSAIPCLEKSVFYYNELVELTKDAYLYANSMQTQQRRIPIDGTNGENKTWEELLPHYQEELKNFKRNVATLQSGEKIDINNNVLEPVDVEIISGQKNIYPLTKGSRVYSDSDYEIADIAPELERLKGLQLNFNEQINDGTELTFKTEKEVKIVVGYFNGHSFKILPPPTLETNAQANNRGQADIKIANAIDIPGLYPVNIYTYKYGPGNHTLKLGNGIALILGFIDGKIEIPMHDAAIGADDKEENIDWLFY